MTQEALSPQSQLDRLPPAVVAVVRQKLSVRAGLLPAVPLSPLLLLWRGGGGGGPTLGAGQSHVPQRVTRGQVQAARVHILVAEAGLRQ